jgi:hypothetical protein
MEMSQMALMLVSHQIVMLFNTANIIIGFPERHINLYGQMARLNLYGMAKGMFLGAACC